MSNLHTQLEDAVTAINAADYARAEELCRNVLSVLDTQENTHHDGEIEESSETRGFLHIRAERLLAKSLWKLDRAKDGLPVALRALEAAQGGTTAAVKLEMCHLLYLLGNLYLSLSDFKECLAATAKALEHYTELNDTEGVALSTMGMALAYYHLSDYSNALVYFSRALGMFEEQGNAQDLARCYGNVGLIYDGLGDFPKALEYYGKAIVLQEELGMKSSVAIVTGNMAVVYTQLGDYPLAVELYNKALMLRNETGNRIGVASATGNIGTVYGLLGEYRQALEFHHRAIALGEELGSTKTQANNLAGIGLIYSKREFEGYDPAAAKDYILRSIGLYEALGTKYHIAEGYKALADISEQMGEFAQALEYFKQFYSVTSEIQNEEVKKFSAQLDAERKQAEHEKQVIAERARHAATEELLHNTLPPNIAARLMRKERPIADHHPAVSILFSDIVGFTTLSSRIPPHELVSGLDKLFTQFDNIATKFGLEKIKTIGDSYMAVAGIPYAQEDHALRAAQMALEMMESMQTFSGIAATTLQIRIGLHTGDIVAGIIGEKKFTYDLWGDAVNTAARMESHGEPGKIHVSEEFLKELLLVENEWLMVNGERLMEEAGDSSSMERNERLMDNGKWLMEETDKFSSFTINHVPSTTNHLPFIINHSPLTIIPRGEMDIKGKGKMKTYFLEKKK